MHLHHEKKMILKRLILHISGLLLLAIGVSFSIQADLGVSPVSSLAYAFSLTTGYSVGVMTIVANIMFIIVQVILSKRFDLKNALVQLMITFIFGFFIDATLFVLQLFPAPETLLMRWGFFMISVLLMPIGLLGCFSSRLTLMPYDELTGVISETFKINLGKAKIYGDSLSVILAGLICIIFIQSLGSVGIGTIIASYAVGKILGWLTKHFQNHLFTWVKSNDNNISSKSHNTTLLKEETSQLPS